VIWDVAAQTDDIGRAVKPKSKSTGKLARVKVVPPDAPRKFKIGWGVGIRSDEQLTALDAAIAAPLSDDVLARFQDVEKLSREPSK